MKKIELTQTLISILNEWLENSQDNEKIEYVKNLINEDAALSNEDLTDKNKNILTWMQDNQKAFLNTFTSRQIGDGIFMSGRAVSGSMRKLVALELVEKSGKDPVCYSLTEKGKGANLKS